MYNYLVHKLLEIRNPKSIAVEDTLFRALSGH